MRVLDQLAPNADDRFKVRRSREVGPTTLRRGWQRATTALLSPPVFGIIVFTLALDVGAVFGVNAAAHALGVHTSTTYTAFTLGALMSATVLVLVGEVFVLSGGVNWITGGLAENETAKVLARLGSEWKVAHNITFPMGKPPNTWEVDVDHVAVGPYGVLVFETKYTSTPVQLHRLSKSHRDIKQARRNAALVHGLLSEAAVQTPIRPVLIYWGWHVKLPTLPVKKVENVRVVYGIDAGRWLPLVSTRQITSETEKRAWAALEQWASTMPQ